MNSFQDGPPVNAEDERYIPEWMIAPETVTFDPSLPPVPTIIIAAEPETTEQRVSRGIAKATSNGLTEMSPAERIASLTAIRDAVDSRIKWEKDTIIENLTGATAPQSIPTVLGKLTFKPSTRSTAIDEDKLLAYVKENHPDQVKTEAVITETIEPEFRALVVSAVVHVGDGEFALSTDGTAIDFAYLGAPSAASIAYPASKEQKIAKLQARKALDEQFISLTSGMIDAAKGDAE